MRTVFLLPVNVCHSGGYTDRGDNMSKEKTQKQSPDLRLEPEKRLCAKFDNVSIATFPVARPGEMGMRVLDNCAEEHQM